MSTTNEWEFQGAVLSWVNDFVSTHSLDFDQATQEFKNPDGKRSDMILWRDRGAQDAILATEFKQPGHALDSFQADAVRKAQKVGAPYVALWNMQTLTLHRTPQLPRKDLLPEDFLLTVAHLASVRKVEDWLKPSVRDKLQEAARGLVLDVYDLANTGILNSRIIDATVFVDALSQRIRRLRLGVQSDFNKGLSSSRRLRDEIRTWAKKQGLEDFVDDLYESLAAQLAYRLTGQALFYHSLRRYMNSLPELDLDASQPVARQLRARWDAVRVFDYEALFEESPLEKVPLSAGTESQIVSLIKDLQTYDWDSIDRDVLGSIFEHMIPSHERRVLGQYYTPPDLADLIISLTMDSPDDVVLDPGVGTGTFLFRIYDRVARTAGRAHADILDRLWGIDISAFPAELAVINLYRQDMSQQSNFPRIAVKDFFEARPGMQLRFPPARRNPGSNVKIDIALPAANVIIGNPPYVRSQQLDDLDAAYKTRLNALALTAGVKKPAKFDAFAYYILHATSFLAPKGRIGFVVPGAWLNSEYGAILQRFILDNYQPIVVLLSEAEVYFPAQDVSTVVMILEKLTSPRVASASQTPLGPMRFISLEKRIYELVPDSAKADYWVRMDGLASDLEKAVEGNHPGYRVAVVDAEKERIALVAQPTVPLDWTRYLRMTEIYASLFGR